MCARARAYARARVCARACALVQGSDASQLAGVASGEAAAAAPDGRHAVDQHGGVIHIIVAWSAWYLVVS